MKKVRKAVFPVAGLGTRFLPATKASPKEMLPVVDKPLIQYAVEEAVAASITDMIFVTGRSKRAIEDYFDKAKAYELESELEARGKRETLEFVRDIIPRGINCIYIRQAEALGLGHAVLCAKPVIGDEPFAVLLADELLDGQPGVMKQMTDTYDYYRCSVLGARRSGRAARRHRELRHRRCPARRGAVGADQCHCRKAEAGGSTIDAGRGRPLHSDPAHLPSSRNDQDRFRRRDPVDGRHRLAARRGTGARLSLFRHPLRLWFELGYLQASVVFGCRHPEVGAAFAAYRKSLET